jgi:hypothetical protein
MTAIAMTVVLLAGQAPAQDPGELVRRLGSPSYAERESAKAALEAMGRSAMPALRDAGASKDPELRSRAAAVLARIEWRELKAASPVRLDVADRPLVEVIERFGFPSPSRLAWHPDTPEEIRRRRVTIREPSPLPFWSAIDRLCQAGGLRYIPGSPGGPGDGRPPQSCLFLTPGTMICPRADSGPFRLEIVAISQSRHVNLIPNRPGYHEGRGPIREAFGTRSEDFQIVARILAEPRMLIRQVGDALIAEAVDDRGQSLLPGPAPHLHHYGYSFGGEAHACAAYYLTLKYPDQAGPVIKRLKLTIALGVETLTPDRLEIPLADAVGKTFRHGRTTIEVASVGRDPAGHQKVKLKLRTEEAALRNLSLDRTGAPAPVPGGPGRAEVSPNVIQVLDQQGRQFPWHVGTVGPSRMDSPEITAELTMWPAGGIPIPVRAGHGVVPVEDRATAVPTVLYHTETASGFIASTFEFHDIPLP